MHRVLLPERRVREGRNVPQVESSDHAPQKRRCFGGPFTDQRERADRVDPRRSTHELRHVLLFDGDTSRVDGIEWPRYRVAFTRRRRGKSTPFGMTTVRDRNRGAINAMWSAIAALTATIRAASPPIIRTWP